MGSPFFAIPLAIFAVGFALGYLFEKFGNLEDLKRLAQDGT